MVSLSTPGIQDIEVEKNVEKTIEVPGISEEAQKKIEDLQAETNRLIEEREKLEGERDEKTEQVKAKETELANVQETVKELSERNDRRNEESRDRYPKEHETKE